MLDGNTYALNKYLAGEEQLEEAQEQFMLHMDEEMEEIIDLIYGLRKEAKDFQGYDMTEFLEETIKGL